MTTKVTVNTSPGNRVSVNTQQRTTVRTVGVSSGGGGGEGITNFSQLQDVIAVNPANNDTVVYDSVTGKYTVKPLPVSNTTIQVFNSANAAYDKANSANLLAFAIGGGLTTANAAIVASYDKANSANLLAFAIGGGLTTANLSASAAYDKANSANLLAFAIGGAVTTANAIASASYDKANSANILAFQVGGAVTTANAIAVAAYNNANSKFSSSGGTITGDVDIVGNLRLSGNTVFVDATRLQVNDPLIYLAGNNYINDIVDIGFIANYVNATGSNVHTGLLRDHETKEYYIFQGYDKEPINNHVDTNGNNFTIAILNADLRTSNLVLGGINAITWITSSYDKANAANVLAFSTGAGTNTYLLATIAGANTAVGTGANAFTSATIAGANTAVGAGANAFAAATVSGANTIAIAAFIKANTGSATVNAREINSDTTLLVSDNYIFANATLNISLIYATGNIAKTYTIYNTGNGTVTVIPQGSDTINGYANMIMQFQNSAFSVTSTGSKWLIS